MPSIDPGKSPVTAGAAQVRLNRVSATCWRVIMNNPPLNLMGPEFVLQFRDLVDQIESDEQLRVVVFESAVNCGFQCHTIVAKKDYIFTAYGKR